MLLTEFNKAGIIPALIEAGGDIEAIIPHQGKTSLSCTAYSGLCAVVPSLLQLGASVRTRNKDGWTPSHLAARTAKPTRETCC